MIVVKIMLCETKYCRIMLEVKRAGESKVSTQLEVCMLPYYCITTMFLNSMSPIWFAPKKHLQQFNLYTI